MDVKSEKALEFDKVKVFLSEHTVSEMGKKNAREIEPYNDIHIIRKRLKIVSQFKELIGCRERIPIYGLKDVSPILKKAQTKGAMLEPSEIYNIADNLEIGKNVKSFFYNKKDEYPELYPIVQSIEPMKNLFEIIIVSVDGDGNVLDSASAGLKKIRKEIIKKEEDVRIKLDKILKKYSKLGYTREDIVTIKDGRGAIPVKEEFISKVEGIAHHRSSTGATLFIEPLEIIWMNNSLEEVRLREDREVRRILRELTVVSKIL